MTRSTSSATALCENFRHRSSIRNGQWSTEIVVNLCRMIDAQQIVHRRRQIAGANRIPIGNGTVFVGLTVDRTTFHATTG